ncbi:MAG: glycosyltransferase, partial [Atopostipes sp.]|nr:glycosyltransferase [Atopostipes sp.]
RKFVTFTEEDKKIIKGIIDSSAIETDITWFTIPNPSKTKRKQQTSYTKNVMYLGRFDLVQKNVLEYAKIQKKLPNKFTLNMYGYGSAEPILKTLDLNLKGKIKDISEVANQNSILLLLSKSEGFGNVLVEAMSVGMPIIVYDSYPAAKSIVSEGVGKLIPYGESDQVIEAIQEILKDKETFEEFSNQAYQESKKYEKERIIQQYRKVLDL